MDGDRSEISKTSTSKFSSLGQGTLRCIIVDDVFSLAHAQIVHMLIVLLSLLCT